MELITLLPQLIYHWFRFDNNLLVFSMSPQGLCASGDAGGDAWARLYYILMGHDGPIGCQREEYLRVFKIYLRW